MCRLGNDNQLPAPLGRGEEHAMKRLFTVLALGLALAVGATSAQAAKGDKAANKAAKAGKRDKAAMGTVLKVDNGTITIQGRGKNAAETTITTDANTKFEGVTSAADIKPGMRVIATPSTGTAQKLTVHDPQAKGKGARKLKNK
jgi:hypothetical protein